MLDNITNPHADQSNTPADARDAFFKEVGTLARVAGAGARSLLGVYRATVVATSRGLLSTETTKGEKDDAAKIYAHYQENYAKKDQIGSVAQQTSKLRAFIKGTLLPNVDGVQLFDTAMQHYRDIKAANPKASLKPEVRAMCDVFTEQLKQPDQQLDDEQIKARLEKNPVDHDAEHYIKAAMTALEKAYDIDKREEIETQVNNVRGLLTLVTRESEQAEDDVKLAELLARRGLTLADVQDALAH